MLKVGYRNIYITFEDHTNLEIQKNDLDKLFSRLDILLDSVKARYNRNVFDSNSASFVRLKGSENLVIYIGIGSDNNPYLLLYNSKTKEITNNFPYDLFKMLEKDIIMGDLEEKIKNLGTGKYNDMISPEVFEQLRDYIEK